MNNTNYEMEICTNAITSAYKKGYEDGTSEKPSLIYKKYEQGLTDAWECAKKIYEMPAGEVIRIFGSVSSWVELTAQEAINRIKYHENKKNKTEVSFHYDPAKDGVVVQSSDGREKFISMDELVADHPIVDLINQDFVNKKLEKIAKELTDEDLGEWFPVTYENGEQVWEEYYVPLYACSKCGGTSMQSDYCPDCGKKMKAMEESE